MFAKFSKVISVWYHKLSESVNILYLYSRLVPAKISTAQHIHEVPLSLAGGATLILIRVWRILLLGHVLFCSPLLSGAIDERQIAPPSITYQWQIENIFWAEIYGKNLGSMCGAGGAEDHTIDKSKQTRTGSQQYNGDSPQLKHNTIVLNHTLHPAFL